ncbi:DUF2510 domain-containing protein, partial [Streptomyces sp. NPDC057676]
MSVPGDSGPTQGYYPDPSIPGYIRYWNGSAWVPGTSRPAPSEGEAVPAPPPDVAAQGQLPVPGEEPPIDTTQQAGAVPDHTGPVFFDEQPDATDQGGALPELRPRGEVGLRPTDPTRPADAAPWHDPQSPPGARPAPGGGWYADTARQAGFGGEADQRVSWGAEDPAYGRPDSAPAWGDGPSDPRLVPPTGIAPPPAAAPGTAAPAASADVAPPADRARGRELDPGAAPRAALPAGQGPAVPQQGGAPVEPGPTAGQERPADAVPARGQGPAEAGTDAASAPRAGRDGTLTIRAVRRGDQDPEAGEPGRQDGATAPAGQRGGRDGTLTIRALGRQAPAPEAPPAADAGPAPAATAPQPATAPPASVGPAAGTPAEAAHPRP